MEGLTYEILDKADVPNIPRCIAFGDISTTTYHATKTFTYSSAVWSSTTLTSAGSADLASSKVAHFVPHRHYCLVLDVIGCGLMAFKSSHEMVKAVRDTIVGRFDDPIADEQH